MGMIVPNCPAVIDNSSNPFSVGNKFKRILNGYLAKGAIGPRGCSGLQIDPELSTSESLDNWFAGHEKAINGFVTYSLNGKNVFLHQVCDGCSLRDRT